MRTDDGGLGTKERRPRKDVADKDDQGGGEHALRDEEGKTHEVSRVELASSPHARRAPRRGQRGASMSTKLTWPAA